MTNILIILSLCLRKAIETVVTKLLNIMLYTVFILTCTFILGLASNNDRQDSKYASILLAEQTFPMVIF